MIQVNCPVCNAPMVERVNSKTDEPFYGCSRYPDCKGTRPISETEKMRRAGATTLFDEVNS